MFQFAALLALGLCAEPQDGAKPATGTDAAKPAADVTKLEADVKAVLFRLDGLEKALKNYDEQHRKIVELLGETVQNQINDINKKLSSLRAEVDELKKARVSTSEKRAETNTAMATVMLVNARVDMPMQSIVNGETYWVGPNQNRTISVPAGALRVRVVETDAMARERRLDAGAMHVVTLR